MYGKFILHVKTSGNLLKYSNRFSRAMLRRSRWATIFIKTSTGNPLNDLIERNRIFLNRSISFFSIFLSSFSPDSYRDGAGFTTIDICIWSELRISRWPYEDCKCLFVKHGGGPVLGNQRSWSTRVSCPLHYGVLFDWLVRRRGRGGPGDGCCQYHKCWLKCPGEPIIANSLARKIELI